MRNIKGKVELRYYEIAQKEYLFTLQGESWRRVYEYRGGLLHFHNLLEIGVCREGDGFLLMEDSHVPYRPGMISVIPKNYPHGTAGTEGTESFWEYLFVDVDKMLGEMYPDDVLFRQEVMDRINQTAFLRPQEEVREISTTVEAIFQETEKKQSALNQECIGALTVVLMVQLARAHVERPDAKEEASWQKTGFKHMLPALEYIRKNYASPIKVSDIAASCHMSESHFRRLFEENIGMTPLDYLNRIRIWRACYLIRRTGNSMEEIAVKVGFSTASTFNRNFKRVTGTSPYQWKKQPEQYESRLNDLQITVEKGW